MVSIVKYFYQEKIETREIHFSDDSKCLILSPLSMKYGDIQLMKIMWDLSINYVNKFEIKYIILDFSRAEDISSTSIGLLLKLANDLQEKQCDIVLANPSKTMHTIFKNIGLDKMFRTYPNNYQALLAFRSATLF
ncbi:MAG: STAS domain-containing protein [Candidatus Brocadiae bacterium]|nr:STAS domain-containing protein [Candidatus Brocadiia bacterium]